MNEIFQRVQKVEDVEAMSVEAECPALDATQ
jgi:hypothetical protein